MKSKFYIWGMITLFSLVSCGGKTESKVSLYYKDDALTSISEFSDEESLKTALITKEENFILAGYGEVTCSCWQTFKHAVLNPFVSDTKIPVYAINMNLLSGNRLGLPANGDPVVALYEKGVIKYSLAYSTNSGDNSVFTDRDGFENWLDRYATRPQMTYISFDKLNTLLLGTTPFILNWSLSVCPDCKILDGEFMPEYLRKNSVSEKLPYYIIETAPIRANYVWADIKDMYGLTDKYNETYGFSTGFVPTLQVISPDGTDHLANGNISPIITDMLVYRNESIREENGRYYISDSYFNGVRATKYAGDYVSLIDTELDSTQVYQNSDTGAWYLKAGERVDIQNIYAEKFFNHYWK